MLRASPRTTATYRRAGVDLELANRLLRQVTPMIHSTRRREVLGEIGGFGALFALQHKRYREPILVSSTDGVGTKLKVAILTRRHDTIGIDLVAMNVNDVVTTGAEPLFFLDYLATGKLASIPYVEILRGIARGCREAGCALIGGETAEMPGMYRPGEYDLAGFCVGVVERSQMTDARRVKRGDILIGLASSGLHANGFSLIRTVFSSATLKRLAPELLRPTRMYAKPILGARRKVPIKAMAHITGGAFFEKLARIVPRDLTAVIRRGSWPVPPIFRTIQEAGAIADAEMYHTFNMGIGMVAVVARLHVEPIVREMRRFRLAAWPIGEIIRGRGEVLIQ